MPQQHDDLTQDEAANPNPETQPGIFAIGSTLGGLIFPVYDTLGTGNIMYWCPKCRRPELKLSINDNDKLEGHCLACEVDFLHVKWTF